MPLIKSASKKALSQNISEMVKAGHPQKQAVAAAYRMARKMGAKFATGGDVPERAGGGPVSAPWYERQASRGLVHGYLHSGVPGRTDKLPINVPSGSFVVPADVVSHLGQNNSNAGAHKIRNLIMGGSLARTPKRMGMPKMFAQGGEVGEEPVPIIAAGGEYIIHPDHVRQIGGGDIKAGHDKLDKWVVDTRKHHIKTLQKLPGPKGAHEYADGGVVDRAMEAVRGFAAIPRDAYRGDYARPMAPGKWTEEDEELRRIGHERLIRDALRLSGWGLAPTGGGMLTRVVPESLPGVAAGNKKYKE